MQYQTENNVLNVARRFEDRFEQVPDVDEFEKEHTSLHARREWPNRRPTPWREHYVYHARSGLRPFLISQIQMSMSSGFRKMISKNARRHDDVGLES